MFNFFCRNKLRKNNEKNAVTELKRLKDIVVLKTIFVSSKNFDDCGPKSKEIFFLAVKKSDDEYYELFSNKKIEKESKYFDEPYIIDEQPFENYVIINEDKIICQSDLISLMDFILKLNIEEELKCTCDE